MDVTLAYITKEIVITIPKYYIKQWFKQRNFIFIRHFKNICTVILVY